MLKVSHEGVEIAREASSVVVIENDGELREAIRVISLGGVEVSEERLVTIGEEMDWGESELTEIVDALIGKGWLQEV